MLIVFFSTHHCIGFTTASLPIRKNCSIIPINNTLYNSQGRSLIYLLLRNILTQNFVKCKRPHLLILTHSLLRIYLLFFNRNDICFFIYRYYLLNFFLCMFFMLLRCFWKRANYNFYFLTHLESIFL